MNQKEHCHRVEFCVREINQEVEEENKSFERIKRKHRDSIKLIKGKMKPMRKRERTGYTMLETEYYHNIKILQLQHVKDIRRVIRRCAAKYGLKTNHIVKILGE